MGRIEDDPRIMELEALVQTMLSSHGGVRLIIEESGRVAATSDAARSSLGFVDSEASSFFEILESGDSRAVEAAMASSAPTTIEISVRLQDGAFTATNATFIPTQHNGKNCVLLTLDEIETVAPASTGVRETLFDTFGNVTGRILHDLRNYMLPLVGHIELAMASVNPESSAYVSLLEVQRACNKAEESLESLAEITPERRAPSTMHVGDILERARVTLRYVLPRRATVSVDANDETQKTIVRGTALERALGIFVLQAVDRHREPKHVRLSASRSGTKGTVCFSIEIEGKLTAKGHSDTDMVRDMVARLSGDDVHVESTPDRTTSAFRLEALADTEIAAPSSSRGNGEVICIIQSNAMARNLLRTFLVTRGYRVVDAGSTVSLIDVAIIDGDEEDIDDALATLETGPLAPKALLLLALRGDHDLSRFDLPVAQLAKPYRMDEVAEALSQILSDEVGRSLQA